jgi:hypothetical protein
MLRYPQIVLEKLQNIFNLIFINKKMDLLTIGSRELKLTAAMGTDSSV